MSDVKGLDVLEVGDFEELEKLYWWLKKNPTKYKTVALDTTTQLQQMLVVELFDSKVKEGKTVGDWGTMTKGDWGDVASRMKTWITNYRDLPCETVFICQDRVFNQSEEGDTEGMIDPEMGPALSPAVMKHLCAAVSIIGHTLIRTRVVKRKIKKKSIEREVKEYCLRLGPSASHITKFRKPKSVEIPDFLIDPTYEDILGTIEGNN